MILTQSNLVNGEQITKDYINEAYDDHNEKELDQYPEDKKHSEDPSNYDNDFFKDFCVNTSGHGFFKIVESTSRIKLIWITIMLSTTIGLFVHLIILLIRYFEYGTNSELYISNTNELQMPDVTFCPIQRFAFYQHPTDVANLSLSPLTDKIGPSITFHEKFEHLKTIWLTILPTAQINDLARYSMLRDSYLGGFLRGENDTIIRLNYNNKDARLIEYLPMPTFDSYFCTTFQPKMRNLPRLDETFEINTMLGTFFVGNDNQWDEQMKSNNIPLTEGVNLYLHEANTMPDFNRGPEELALGYLKSLAFYQTQHKRYPINNRCKLNPGNINIRGYGLNDIRSYKYSKSLCVETEKSYKMFQTCNCRSEVLLVSDKIPLSTPFCHEITDELNLYLNKTFIFSNILINQSYITNLLNNLKSRHLCHKQWIDDLKKETFSKICPPDCDEKEYFYDKSSMILGTAGDVYDSVFKESLIENINQISNSSRSKRLLQAIVAGIQVSNVRYFTSVVSLAPKSLSVQITEETLSYPLGNYFSDIGGILGLYLGFSAITVLEIFELFLQHFVKGRKCCKKTK